MCPNSVWDVCIWLPSLVSADYTMHARIVFQHRLLYEHDKISFYGLTMLCSAVRWDRHAPPWPFWCQKFLPFCTFVPFFHPQSESVVTSSLLFFFFLFPQNLTNSNLNYFLCCGFLFLCQRLFKGKVSDIVVWYHFFFLKLKLFRVDRA